MAELIAPRLQLETVSFDEAQRIVLESAKPLPFEVIELDDACGRVAAEAIVASSDLVPFARSAMDGYAVLSADTSDATDGARIRLKIAGAVFAEKGSATHAAGTATSISTGGPIPQGADAVIPFEFVTRDGDVIEVTSPTRSGEHVFPPGEDAHGGETLIESGQELTPSRAGLAALAGYSKLAAHRRPRVAIVCTGDELVSIADRPEHGQIRNSNLPMLTAMARACGGEVTMRRTVPDDRSKLRVVLAEALETSDVVVTTGGASVGPRDFVKGTFAELGVELRFGSVAMRPARPVGFGLRGDVCVFALPGNPAAAFVGFTELARSAILRRAGRSDARYADVPAILDGSVRAKANRTYFVFGRLSVKGSELRVTPIVNQCSALVRTAADSDALIVLPPADADLQSGDRVVVHVLT